MHAHTVALVFLIKKDTLLYPETWLKEVFKNGDGIDDINKKRTLESYF